GRAVPGDDLLPACGDLVDRLVPADPLPRVSPLGADAAQRVLKPGRRLDPDEVRTGFGAQPAPADRMVGIGPEVDGPAIAHLDQGSAGIGAIVGAGAANGHRLKRNGHGSFSPWPGGDWLRRASTHTPPPTFTPPMVRHLFPRRRTRRTF